MTVTIQNILNYVDSVALAQGEVDLFIPVPHGKTFKAKPTELQTIVNNTTNTDKFLLFPNSNNGTYHLCSNIKRAGAIAIKCNGCIWQAIISSTN
jgi:hypothetical protein